MELRVISLCGGEQIGLIEREKGNAVVRSQAKYKNNRYGRTWGKIVIIPHLDYRPVVRS